MRIPQKPTTKSRPVKESEPVDECAQSVTLEPAGYPLKSPLNDYPEIADKKLFTVYAKNQWDGCHAKKGSYLFDQSLFPDFAFKVTRAVPDNSIIGASTKISIKKEKTKSPLTHANNSDITFNDIVGQKIAKQKCRIIERYLKEPEKYGEWAPRNVLFYGPPGTGKTMLAKAIANECSVPFIPVNATQLIGEYVGDGSRQIHQLYETAEELGPAIIFIDELDGIALSRKFQEVRGDVSEIVNALLTEIGGFNDHKGVCTIAATNFVSVIDVAIRSRFEQEIEFALPTEDERLAIIESNLKTYPLPLVGISAKDIAQLTKGLSGRDLVEKVLKSALHVAIMDDSFTDESKRCVTKEHIDGIMKSMNRDVSKPPAHMFL